MSLWVSTASSERMATAVTILYVMIVVISWGTNYPLMKLAIRDMPPLTFSAARLFGGALVITVIMFMSGADRLFPARAERIGLAVIGMLQLASVLGLAGIALIFMPAGRTVTVIYSMPLWAALFSVLLLRVRLTHLQIGGVVISFCGLLLFMDPSVVAWHEPETALAMGLALLAASAWGLGAVLYRARDWQASVLSQTLWQLLMAGCVLTVVAILFERHQPIRFTPSLWAILIWNWLVPTALAVWAWCKVLNRMSAASAGQLLMSTPFVGIAFSAWLFDENLPPVFAGSATLIALGGLMVLMRRLRN